jgi:hypothetical protein
VEVSPQEADPAPVEVVEEATNWVDMDPLKEEPGLAKSIHPIQATANRSDQPGWSVFLQRIHKD